MVAFHPVLQLAGAVARVGACFEHGYNNDLDRNRRVRGQAGGGCEEGTKDAKDLREDSYVPAHEPS